MSSASRKLPFKVRRSAIHGRGAFATRRIRPGARIIEYTGERIDGEEADARYDDDTMERHHTFLFEIDDETYIDAAHHGNEARFINHSCDPNCAPYLIDRRIIIEATKNIQPGVELGYDYAFERDGRYRAEWKRLYACHCGSPKCRGTILKRPKMTRPKKTRRAKTKKRRSSKARR